MSALTVALETSTRAPSVAVRRADGEVHSRVLAESRMHAGDLLPTLAGLLAPFRKADADEAMKHAQEGNMYRAIASNYLWQAAIHQ